MAFRSPLINVMVAAANKAGRGLRRDFGELENLQVSKKGPADFVSVADRRSEDLLVAELTKARPGFGFLLEEGGVIEGSDRSTRWIIDPLDGTTNFLHGLAHFAISIAVERDGELIAGVIYNPVTDELYWGERGVGAFHGERRLRVAGRSDFSQALIATGIPFMGHGDEPQFLKEMKAVMGQVSGIRRFGAAALDLAYVAAGRFDAFWESGLSPWDLAAGVVLVREAGGYVTDIKGRRDVLGAPELVAGNQAIHEKLRRTLESAREKPAA